MEQTTRPNYICLPEALNAKTHIDYTEMDEEKYTPVTLIKRAGGAELLSARAGFRGRRVTGDEEGRHVMTEESILQRERRNNSQCVHTSHSKPHDTKPDRSRWIRCQSWWLQHHLSEMDGSIGQKPREDAVALSSTINQADTVRSYRRCVRQQRNTHPSQAHVETHPDRPPSGPQSTP